MISATEAQVGGATQGAVVLHLPTESAVMSEPPSTLVPAREIIGTSVYFWRPLYVWLYYPGPS